MYNFFIKNIIKFKLVYLYLALIYFCKFYLTTFNIIEINFTFLGKCLPVIALFLLLIDNKETIRWQFVLLVGAIYLVSNTNYNYVNDIQITLLLIVLFSNENPVLVIKSTFWFMFLYFVFNVAFSCIGVLPFRVLDIGERYHLVFNFAHHNKISLYIFGLMMEAYYLFKKDVFKNKYIILVMFILSTSYTLFLCDSRTGGIVQLLLTLWIVLDLFILPRCSKFTSLLNLFAKFCWMLPLLTLLISLIISVIYNNNNIIWQFLNNLVSGRFYLQHNYYIKHGFPLLGAGLKFCGYGCDVYDYVDNGFLRFVFENGLLFTTLITFGISLNIKKILNHNNQRMIFFMTFSYCLITIFEWISFLYCPFIIILFSNYYLDKGCKV